MENAVAADAVETCSSSFDREVKRVTSNASRKESFRRRNGYGKADRVNLDDVFGVEENRDSSLIFKKHLLEALDYDSVSMKVTVAAELKDMGIEIDITNQRQSRSKSRKVTAATPGNSIQASVGGEQFLETVEVKLEGGMPVRLCIPTIVKQTCEFIRKEIHVEGIFRKSGLSSRITSLKQRFQEKVEDVFGPDDTVFDATSALKQYLRELSSPLIPFETHASFLKCLECEDEKSKVEAVLTCVFLLPLVNIHVLVYLMQFLHEVMDHAATNKMGHKNIALVITPNIMPLEEKKHIAKGKETIISEKMALEKNRRVVEILILYGDRVGWVSSRLFKALEVQFIYRNSDDELEERGRSGRRKKRRSGSLTRMFGFFRKVTKGGGDTPSSTIDTPNSYMHTPIMKSSKKRSSDEPMFSVQKKKTILDAVRKNGLKAGCDSPDGFLACPSPAVCLNPSPTKPDWSVVTPESLFATPCLNRQKKRSKSTPETLILPSSSSSKVSAKNMRLGFGRKSGKKVAVSTNSLACEESPSPESLLPCSSSPSAKSCNAILNISKYLKQFALLPSRNLKQSLSLGSNLYAAEKKESMLADTITSVSCSVIPSSNNPAMLHQQVQQNLLRINQEATMSIHHLPQSPRRRGAGAVPIPVEIPTVPTLPISDIEIPPPPEFCDPPEVQMNGSGDTCESKTCTEMKSLDEGEYVMIPRNMSLHDVRNEAFMEPNESSDQEKDNFRLEDIKLTPLIKEIDKLTMKARQEESSDQENGNGGGPPVAQPLAEVSNLLERRRTPRSDSSKSSSVEEVAIEFRRVVNEEKLIKLKAEIAAAERSGTRQSGIHRRGSMNVATRGVSPSKRRINSFRRRSFDTTKPPGSGVAQSPKFMSLRSPRSRPAPPSITRSPTRCTLRRGRPNTARAGLSRPSPAKGTATASMTKPELPPRRPVTAGAGSIVKAQRSLTQITQQNEPATSGTARSPIIRRMSSVQELVSKLEKKGKGSRSAIDVVPDSQKLQRPSSLCLRSSARRSLPVGTTCRVEDDSQPILAHKVKTPVSNALKKDTPKASTPNQGSEWTDGAEFTFGKSPTFVTTPVVGSRESIHFLKTKNAGKVSANIKMFDGIAKQEPQGPRSMIPRYTALHTIHSQRSLHEPTDE